MQINSMAVFCGSKSGSNPLFTEHAKQLGRLIAEENIVLIYGGGNRGLMGTMANAVLENNGKVIGIIPQVLNEWEHQHEGISELIVVENMHIRKRLLYEKCDAAVILPGGFGTLDELFEILTWNQLSIHNKKVFILNTDGFYNALLKHVNNMSTENFLYNSIELVFTVVSTPQEIFE
jgi:uncharacterized protein (TIGR00730 family)